MLDPLDYDNRPLLDALERNRRKAFCSLVLEKLGLHFWRISLWILFFLSLWLLEVPQLFGYYGLLGCLLTFAGGLAYLIYVDVCSFSLPDRHTIDKRLEKSSQLRKGQISSLEDQLANPHKRQTRLLWDSAQKKSLANIKSIKTPMPRPFLVHKDPRAIRFTIILLFFSAFLVAGSDWQQRLSSGLQPISPNFVLSQGRNIDLWMTPPEYTGLPQIHVQGSGKLESPLNVPEGSTVKLRLFSALGGFAPPSLIMGDKSVPMEHLGEGLYGLETEVADAQSFKIKQLLLTRVNWEYVYITDQAPTIAFDDGSKDKEEDAEKSAEETSKENAEETQKEENQEDPNAPIPGANDMDLEEFATDLSDLPENGNIVEKTENYEILPTQQIRFPFIVKDDYAVTDLHMTMSIDPMVSDKPRGENFEETRLVMSPPNTELKVQPIYDLTWHTWAGLPVVFNFEIKDHKGQTARVEPVKVVLPERSFEHPVAKLLIAFRKKLAWASGRNFYEISGELEALLQTPELFHHDTVVYLAIKTASARLAYTNVMNEKEVEAAANDIIALLWETAISIEDGNLTMAMRNLRQSQRDLENALRDPNITDDEISRLMENLRQDMMEYFTELAREMQKRMEDGEELPQFDPKNFADMVSPDTFSSLMEQIEEALRSGDQDKAKELLSQLQNMMDMMDPQMAAPLPEDMEMQMKGINELQELIERQEELLKQTQEQARLQKFFEGTSDGFAPSIPNREKVMEELGLGEMPPPPTNAKPPLNKNTESQNNENASGSGSGENNKPSSSEQSENTLPDAAQKGRAELEEKFINTQPNKAEQQALRYILGQLMLEATEKLPDVPESMALAELEMRGSEENLGKNNPTGSIPHQEKAIEYLKQAQQDLQKQLKTRMQQMVGLGFGNSQKLDPLGRPYGGDEQEGGNPYGSSVHVPDEAEKKRVEEILKELRRRSGELDRPVEEREYYRRLLRQF